MSRNRCDVRCECGWYSFGGAVLPFGDPDLMTGSRYAALVETRYSPDPGIGFRDDLCGRVFYSWYSPDGNGVASFDCGRGYEKRLSARYAVVPEEDRYRWAKLQCPICRRLYAGWFVLQPWVVEGRVPGEPRYELVDTSFFWAFNDEPSDRDEAQLVEWDEPRLVAALAEYMERHPDEFKRREGEG